MTTAPDDAAQWPTFADNLSRKGMTALAKYVEGNEKGIYTDRDLFIVTDVLFDLMSGLANWSDVDVVNQVHTELREKAARARRERIALGG